MKHMYFLRGLGIGIVFTTIIMIISFQAVKKNSLSESEIIEQARQIGMVFEEDKKLDESLDRMSLGTKQDASTPAVTSTAGQTGTSAASPTASATQKPAKTITFKIKSGMYTNDVAKLLKKKGLISDEGKFVKYMTNKKLESEIKASTYKVKQGTSDKKIAKIITTKK